MLIESLHLFLKAMNKPGNKLEIVLMSKSNRGQNNFFSPSTLLLPPSDISSFYQVLHIKYGSKKGKGEQPLTSPLKRFPHLFQLQAEIIYYFPNTIRGEGTGRNFDGPAAKF